MYVCTRVYCAHVCGMLRYLFCCEYSYGVLKVTLSNSTKTNKCFTAFDWEGNLCTVDEWSRNL